MPIRQSHRERAGGGVTDGGQELVNKLACCAVPGGGNGEENRVFGAVLKANRKSWGEKIMWRKPASWKVTLLGKKEQGGGGQEWGDNPRGHSRANNKMTSSPHAEF